MTLDKYLSSEDIPAHEQTTANAKYHCDYRICNYQVVPYIESKA